VILIRLLKEIENLSNKFIAKKYLDLFPSNAFYDSFRQVCVDKWHRHAIISTTKDSTVSNSGPKEYWVFSSSVNHPKIKNGI
jgi:hypothetical protein